MIVFSKTLFSFAQRLEALLKDILKNETSLVVKKTRFEFQGYLYPIHVVTFESTQKLGYFDPATYQIGVNKNLLTETKTKTLKDILRHELAHYLAFIEFGEKALNHGAYFQEICQRHQWDSQVSKTSLDPQEAYTLIEGDLEAEKVYQKVKNLFKLATSSNQHEAELATLKANQLLIKYNLSHIESLEDDESLFYVHRLMSQKKKNAKLSVIYDIIKHFMVKPVLSYTKNDVALEISGTKTNIELAEYVVNFLDRELEYLWKNELKKSPHLKGLKNKNAFFYGIALGYNEKMQKVKDDLQAESKALIHLQNVLDEKMKFFYRRLGSTSSGTGYKGEAFQRGNLAGKNLSIHQGIKNNQKTFLLN